MITSGRVQVVDLRSRLGRYFTLVHSALNPSQTLQMLVSAVLLSFLSPCIALAFITTGLRNPSDSPLATFVYWEKSWQYILAKEGCVNLSVHGSPTGLEFSVYF